MITFFKTLFKKKPNPEHLSDDGCPKQCFKCGKKAITLRRTLDKHKQPINKFVSCAECKISLAIWENDEWKY